MKYLEKIGMAILIVCMLFTLGACVDEQPDDSGATQTPTAVVTPTPEAPTPTPVDDGTVKYTIKVVDENNNPIANALVQLCLESCYPGLTGADGVASFSREEADYKVSFVSLPAGYTYSTEATEFYFEEGTRDMVITLKVAE